MQYALEKVKVDPNSDAHSFAAGHLHGLKQQPNKTTTGFTNGTTYINK